MISLPFLRLGEAFTAEGLAASPGVDVVSTQSQK